MHGFIIGIGGLDIISNATLLHIHGNAHVLCGVEDA